MWFILEPGNIVQSFVPLLHRLQHSQKLPTTNTQHGWDQQEAADYTSNYYSEVFSCNIRCRIGNLCLKNAGFGGVGIKVKALSVPFWVFPPWGCRGASTSPRCGAQSSPGSHRSRGNAAAARWSCRSRVQGVTDNGCRVSAELKLGPEERFSPTFPNLTIKRKPVSHTQPPATLSSI